MSDQHTPGPWRAGKVGGAIVADQAVDGGPNGGAVVEYYGGHLIAESVASCNRPLLLAAPELLAALRELARAWNATTYPCTARLDAALADADNIIGVIEGRLQQDPLSGVYEPVTGPPVDQKRERR